MANVLIDDIKLTALGDAIRAKTGKNDLMTVARMAEEIAGIGGGGSGSSSQNIRSDVNFIDYDGTILYAYTAEDFQALTEMPANPTHPGLTSQGWNWTLADAKAQVAELGACDIGQMYVTDDGKTRIYIELNEGRLSPYLGICPNGTVVIDWGDGSSTDTLTGTNNTAVQYIRHIYANVGSYTITLEATDGNFSLSGSNNGTYILKTSQTDTSSLVSTYPVYTNSIKKVEIGLNCYIDNYAFSNCYSLSSIIIPNNVTNIGVQAFSRCYSLSSIIIPNSITNISERIFLNCHFLSSIIIPNSVTNISGDAFTNCYSLSSIIIPNSVTNISGNAFSSCYSLSSVIISNNITTLNNYTFISCFSLSSVVIPNNVTNICLNAFTNCQSLSSVAIPSNVISIGEVAFLGCIGLGEIHFLSTVPPVITASNAFAGLPTDCKIYVPTGSLAAYTTATNYPSSDTYTYREE